MTQGTEPTLHQRILREIEERILSGDWPPGYRIPFELDLARHYGCSRMTVNKVLTQLARAGLIERRRKSGSFVAQPQVQSAVLEIQDIRSEVEALGLVYSHRVTERKRRKATAKDIEQFEIPLSSDILTITCVHQANQRPFCFEERVIALEAVPEAVEEQFEALPPGAWLLRHAPWDAAEHKIFAVAADSLVCEALHIGRHAACLVIERQTWNKAGPVTKVRLTYPGDRHRLVARFTPASQ